MNKYNEEIQLKENLFFATLFCVLTFFTTNLAVKEKGIYYTYYANT